MAAIICSFRIAIGLVVERLALHVFPLRGYPLAPGHASAPSGLFSWDAVYYRAIATNGYPKSQPALTTFFPLYPDLVRAVEKVTGAAYAPCALAVSWLALFFATWGVIRLARGLFPDAVAGRAGWLLCWFPASVFLIAGYPEGLFVALSAWTLVALHEHRPWWAAAAAALVGLVRPEGAAAGLAVVAWCLLQPRRQYLQAVALGALSEVGFAAYSVFLWVRFGNPLEEVSVQSLWHRQFSWPFHPLVWSLSQVAGGKVIGPGGANMAADFLLDDAALIGAVVALVALAWWARRRRDLWWVIVPSVVTLAVISSNGPSGVSPESAVRYVMCFVPIFLVPTRLREQTWTIVLVGCGALAVAFQIVFNLGGWFT